ncbi:MAG: hypothetical protein U9Q40_06265 [Campylobacterota bacterium]|nr:hypothetical protein [Campylobacterota bacterium]
MKISISRQHIYLLSILMFLLIFVMIFSFAVLIPKGKEYREDRLVYKKESRELRRYQNFHDEIQEKLKELQVENRHLITAFDTTFNQYRFEKQHRDYFSSLQLSKLSASTAEDEFVSYEVNTTSEISSPKSFYDFLDAINKSDWIIAVEFPINFKRDSEMIKSSFTMKVYGVNTEQNATKKEVE